jgi:hypothetical protein
MPETLLVRKRAHEMLSGGAMPRPDLIDLDACPGALRGLDIIVGDAPVHA